MILDSFKNAHLYYNVSSRMERAFELVSKVDLASLEAGRHDLEGDEIFVNIMELDLKKESDAKLEIHNKYADIQILITGESEGFGWSERADVCKPLGEFDEAKDVQFFDDKAQTIYTLKVGQFTILLPEDAHAPMIGEGHIKKAIVKVLL
ncbi:MAG: YhcH/YjgK/YiaL family protein [Rikenellaceae bacterium]